jgi:uncharacterized membrane protein
MRLQKIVLSGFILMLFSCKHDVQGLSAENGGNTGGGGTGGGTGNGGGGSTNNCDPAKIYFQQQVLPILLSNCTMSGCHDDASHQDGVILTSYEKVIATADIRPGRPSDSDLYEVLVETDPDKKMPRPPRTPLTQQQVQIIYQWIQQGAQYLSCQTSSCDTSAITFSATIRNIISNKCQGCHSGTGASGGIDLSSYSGVKAKVTDGRLWGAINHQPGFSPMPKNGAKLNDCEISQIRKWIDAGSPNN